jgi:hypothetical protein
MPAAITPANTWTTPVNGPANGDPVDGSPSGASFLMGQALANRIEYIKSRVNYVTAGYLGRYVDDPTDANGVIASVTATSYTDMTGWAPSEPVIASPQAGDIILVRAQIHLQFTGAGNGGGWVKIIAYDGTTENEVKGCKVYQSNNNGSLGVSYSMEGWYTIASAVSHSFRLKAKCGGALTTCSWLGGAAILLETLRPVTY